jgi:hypothetical protein
VNRRRLLALAAATGAGLAGCTSGDTGPTTTPRRPAQVTTTSADGVEVVSFELVLRSDAAGPEAAYRFRNAGETDATVEIRTLLRVDGGGEYESGGVINVPAGDEVTLRYVVVRDDALAPDDRERLDRGEFDVTVFVNGEERAGA